MKKLLKHLILLVLWLFHHFRIFSLFCFAKNVKNEVSEVFLVGKKSCCLPEERGNSSKMPRASA
jgi:hypothetical protein